MKYYQRSLSESFSSSSESPRRRFRAAKAFASIAAIMSEGSLDSTGLPATEPDLDEAIEADEEFACTGFNGPACLIEASNAECGSLAL